MRWKVCFVIGCVLVISCVGMAQFTKIELIYEMGMTSSFDTDGGGGGGALQHLGSSNGAWVFDDTGGPATQFTSTNVVFDFETLTDISTGDGKAKGQFRSGNWTVEMFDAGSNVVLGLYGIADWYDESENKTNKVDGRGIITVNDSLTVIDETFWGSGHTWASAPGNKSGVISIISNATQDGGDLEDYATNWSSNNVTMLIYADSSNIPEPATLCLLGLGSLLLRRKRRAIA